MSTRPRAPNNTPRNFLARASRNMLQAIPNRNLSWKAALLNPVPRTAKQEKNDSGADDNKSQHSEKQTSEREREMEREKREKQGPVDRPILSRQGNLYHCLSQRCRRTQMFAMPLPSFLSARANPRIKNEDIFFRLCPPSDPLEGPHHFPRPGDPKASEVYLVALERATIVFSLFSLSLFL